MKVKEKFIIVPINNNCNVLCIDKNGNTAVFNKGHDSPNGYIKLRFDDKQKAIEFIKQNKLKGFKAQKMWVVE